MRMSQSGLSAADIVNTSDEVDIADILFQYGEERASRRIAKAIVKRREDRPFSETLDLAEVIEKCLPRSKPGQAHPATRSFQALRIAVNDEYGELYAGLLAAERALKPGGLLVVVTFHSIEDRIVKRFFQARSGQAKTVSRHAPALAEEAAQFDVITRKAVGPDDQELDANPRSRSAKLRIGRRTDAPTGDALSTKQLGMPSLRRG
jgi:16S rRNA (cytosine1402-N4)-methyltransferase